MILLFGLLCLVQGVGGIINYYNSSAKSWYLLNYIPALHEYRLAGNIVIAALGLICLLGSSRRN